MRETMLAPFETSFADALLNADQPIPSGITAHNAAVPTQRFAVYRNNVVMGLGKALKSRFPVVEKIVGEEFFAAMARVFVLKQPPRSPLLAIYGDEFAAFIATFEPARELPYLADVARLEAARTHSYHAADAAPIDACQLATLDTCDVGSIRIDMHPSVGIVRSPYPIVAIWAMNSGEQELATIQNWRGEDALVARPYLEVEVRALPPGGAAFLLALAGGRILSDAAEAALADDSNFDLTGNIAGLIGSGLVRDIVLPEPKSCQKP
jgi:putative DNA-binding protein